MAYDFTPPDHVIVSDNAILTIADNATLAFWVWIDSNAGTSYQYFWSWGDFGATPSINLYIGETDNVDANKLILNAKTNIGDAIVFSVASTLPTSLGQWHHLLLRGSTSQDVQCYHNGVLVATANREWGDINVADGIYFGNRAAGSRGLDGKMAEMSQWNRYLSDGEVAALAKGYSAMTMPYGLSWYIKGIRDTQELIVPLTVTNQGAEFSRHSPIIYSKK